MPVNKLKYCLFPLLFIILIGCSAEVAKEDLIDGYWVATAGYKDGEPDGEPYCSSVVTEGLEFKNDETVYVEAYEREFTYWLEDNYDGVEIYFIKEDLGINISYSVDKIDEDRIGLIGQNLLDESCYLERE